MVLGGLASHGQQDGGGRIYWTEGRDLGWIQRSDLGGSNIESVLSTELEVKPNRIALDPVLGKIYWTEVGVEAGRGGGSIRRANLDGSGVETLITGLQDPFDLALDLFEHKMYWTDLRGGTIKRAGLDGDNVETLVTGLEAPADIALDMYLDYIDDPCPTCAPNIQPVPHPPDSRSAAKSASHSPHSVGAPARMYWTDRRAGTIQQADLDGTNVETLVTGIGSPAGLFVSWGTTMFWADRDTGTIQWAGLSGSNVETIVTGAENVITIAPHGDFPYGDLLWIEWNGDSEIGAIRGSRLTRDESGSYTAESYTISETTNGPGDLEIAYGGGLYWTDTNRIYRTDDYWRRRATNQSEPISMGIQGPTSIALDLAGDRMYWVDKWTNTIRRSGLDGAQVEDLVTEVETPEDIALDLAAGKMYWAEQSTGAILRADLDGSNGETLVEAEGPMGIALDVTGGRMYWTARGDSRFSDGGVIQRSNLDGSQIETLVAGLGDPEDIALDLIAGKLYWIEAGVSPEWWPGDGRILRFDLDGSNTEVLITGLERPEEIALDVVEGKLYWTDKQGGSIHRADLDGGNVEEVVTGLVRPVGIALDVPLPDTPPDTKRTSRTEVVATVLGDPVEGLTVEFARSISGQAPHFAWSAVTDAAGRLALTIPSREERDTSGLYQARALTATGEVVGRWEGISLDFGSRHILELTLESGVRVVASERLEEPNSDPCSNGIVVPDPLINRDLVEDCGVLLGFRDSRDEGTDLDWSASTPIHWWEGIQIRDGRVRVISFYPMDPPSIYGPIPPELGQLAGLEVLDLTGVRGSIPPELGQLTELRALYLAWNGAVTGPIPPELGNLTTLERMYLNNNSLTGPIPAELGNLTELKKLNLSNNELTGPIPPELGNLTNLTDSSPSFNEASGFDLSHNRFTGPIPPELGKLTQVRTLHLPGNMLTGPIPPELVHFTSLKLSFNEMTGPIPPGLEQLTELTSLSLSYNMLTGPIPPELGQLKNLKGLTLQDNALTGPIPQELVQLTQLERLNLSKNRLTGGIPPGLGDLTNLMYLDLSENELTGLIPPELGNLIQLKSLILSSNKLTGTIPPELAQLTTLEWLGIADNQLTGCVPAPFVRWAKDFPVCSGFAVFVPDCCWRSINGIWRSERSIPENASPGTSLGPARTQNAEDAVLQFSFAGPDSTAFAIDAAGEITVGPGTMLNFEVKKSYSLVVYLSDGVNYEGFPDPGIDDSLLVTIDLKNVEEAGIVIVSPIHPVVGVPLTATLRDPDGLVRYDPPRWQWQQSENLPAPGWDNIPGAKSDVYKPVAEDEGKLLRATVTYGDGHGSGKSAESEATPPVATSMSPADSIAAADFDGDGAVGFGDFFLFADAFGGTDSRFDLDGSGAVDFADFFLLADHFGQPARGKLLALAREMIGLPDGPQLQNAPNPFNGRTVFSWFILSPGPVRLDIYNTLGQPVRTLVDEVLAAGRHQVYWDVRDQRGALVAAGVYLSRLQYPGGVQTQRLLFLK